MSFFFRIQVIVYFRLHRQDHFRFFNPRRHRYNTRHHRRVAILKLAVQHRQYNPLVVGLDYWSARQNPPWVRCCSTHTCRAAAGLSRRWRFSAGSIQDIGATCRNRHAWLAVASELRLFITARGFKGACYDFWPDLIYFIFYSIWTVIIRTVDSNVVNFVVTELSLRFRL